MVIIILLILTLIPNLLAMVISRIVTFNTVHTAIVKDSTHPNHTTRLLCSRTTPKR